MIEVVYNEDKTKMKLPKNIRQVGRPNEKTKIYIEDYVITYINQLSDANYETQKMIILLGNIKKDDYLNLVFVEGAIEVKKVQINDDKISLTSEIWSEIYNESQKYFKAVEVIGWCLSRPGKSLDINETLENLHKENFYGANKLLFMMDPLDNDEVFYINIEDKLTPQDGYYIYYERNDAMQNYMVESKNYEGEERNLVVANIRKTVEETKERVRIADTKNTQFVKKYGSLVATFVLLVALYMGITALTNQKNNRDVTSGAVANKETNVTPVEVVEVNAPISKEESVVVEKETKENQTEAENKETEAQTQETAADVSTTQETPKEYTICTGDTLVSISKKFYSNSSYVEKIKELNAIEDPHKIYPGMKIKLP